jgi:tryptophan halogenase
MKEIRKAIVVGGGSAGAMSALTLKTKFPHIDVTMIRSSQIPIIGVGESTTPVLPSFLHGFLGLPVGEFLKAVKPTWKLGIRFEWGPKEREHFLYTFDYQYEQKLSKDLPHDTGFYAQQFGLENMTVKSACCYANKSPFLLNRKTGKYMFDGNNGYHIENHTFVAYLEKKCEEVGVRIMDARIDNFVLDEHGNTTEAWLEGGKVMEADFFIDCSGFAAAIIGKRLQTKFIDYKDKLLCDRSIVGGWSRDEAIRSFTGADTMDSGWRFRVELRDRINCGYVFSSQFISDDDAAEEYNRSTDGRADTLRVVPFQSGRYERFWVGNVLAIGNAAGFVEPLEATALHMVCNQLGFMCDVLSATDCRPTETMKLHFNTWIGNRWDEIRDFLTVHYKFNQRRDTPFWKHCREALDIGMAQPILEYYQDSGPANVCKVSFMPSYSLFGFEGYLAMFVGMNVPTKAKLKISDAERQRWATHTANNKRVAESALSNENACELASGTLFSWEGVTVQHRANPALF